MSKAEKTKIFDYIIVIGNQLSNQKTGYQKAASLKAAIQFFEKPVIFNGYTWLENVILAANCLNVVCVIYIYIYIYVYIYIYYIYM